MGSEMLSSDCYCRCGTAGSSGDICELEEPNCSNGEVCNGWYGCEEGLSVYDDTWDEIGCVLKCGSAVECGEWDVCILGNDGTLVCVED